MSQASCFGAHRLPDGQTRFRLWAPALSQVRIEFDDGRHGTLAPQDGGWFEGCFDVAPGTGYRYALPGGRTVPDPASRQQRDDLHGFSVVTDPQAYPWRHPHWRGRPWHEAVLYEMHVGLCGGFAAAEARLPALAELGVTMVELMPVADFPGDRNWGYDGVLPYAPARAYGTPRELKSLVDTAHGLGLMVMLDVVYNHFGPDGNHLHAYAPAFFREDRHTPWGAAIDFRREPVRAFFAENARYWLEEFRFDGLRLDAVHAIEDEGWLDALAVQLRAELEPRRHVHLVLENDRNEACRLRPVTVGKDAPDAGGYDAQWNDDLHHALHVLLTGEREGYYADYAEAPAVQLARCLAEGFAYQGERSERHQAMRGQPSAHLPPTAFVSFLQNHDQIGNRAFGERLDTLADPAALRAALALLLLAPQIPLVFMGQEWGARDPFLFFTDHGPELAQAVRDGRRREFAHFAAFADPQARARIPDPNARQTFEHSRPQPPAQGAQAHFDAMRALLRLRREHVVPGLRDACSLGAQALGDSGVIARWRLGTGEVLSLATQLGAESLPDFVAPSGRLIYPDASAFDAGAGVLPGHCTLAFVDRP